MQEKNMDLGGWFHNKTGRILAVRHSLQWCVHAWFMESDDK